jgi:hypothetical protein
MFDRATPLRDVCAEASGGFPSLPSGRSTRRMCRPETPLSATSSSMANPAALARGQAGGRCLVKHVTTWTAPPGRHGGRDVRKAIVLWIACPLMKA